MFSQKSCFTSAVANTKEKKVDGEGSGHGEGLSEHKDVRITCTSPTVCSSHDIVYGPVYGPIVYAWKISEIKYESRKLMLQDRCCSSPLNSKREKHPTFRGFLAGDSMEQFTHSTNIMMLCKTQHAKQQGLKSTENRVYKFFCLAHQTKQQRPCSGHEWDHSGSLKTNVS